MNCSDISELTPLYLTGELEQARADDFAAHLKYCQACRRAAEQQAEFDRLLRASVLDEHIDSSSVERRVRAHIAGAESRRTSRHRMLAAVGIAAALLAAVLGYRAMSSSPHVTPFYAAAARDHRLEIVDGQPRKWFIDRASMGGLAERQGLPDSVIEGLAPAGYHLAKAKLCLLDGRVFLHLVYANGAGNVSVFLRRPDGEVLAGTATIAAEHVAGFQRGPWIGMVVTEESSAAASRLATLASASL